MIASHRFPMYKPLNNLCDIDYILYKFLTKHGKFLLGLASPGGAGRNKTLGQNEFKKLKVIVPKVEEQQKIADFLTCIGIKIGQLTKKKELLECYKKGVMQQIFSQTIRFKDDNGKDYRDWETKLLGDISTDVMYGMNSAAVPFDGKNKYLRITDIDNDSRKLKLDSITSPEGKLEPKFKLKEGDMVFARTGASVGKSYLYNRKDGNLFFAGFLIKFSIITSIPYFVYIQTFEEKYSKWVKIMSMRSGQPGINAEEYKTFKVECPSVQEQQKIVNYISELDNKISLVEKQINGTKLYKKGLLQQMFV